jgi:Rhs element Vgr protein
MSAVSITILSAGSVMPVEYAILSIDITRDVNRIPFAQLVLVDGDSARQSFAISNADFFTPGRLISISLRYEGSVAAEDTTVFKGVVVGQRVEAGAQGSLLNVTLKDAAVGMTQVRHSAVYREQSDDTIIGELIAKHGLERGTIAPTQPQHQELVQYYCTDWDFIRSRAEANGLLVCVDDGTIALAQIAIPDAATHTFEFGQGEIYDLEIAADLGKQFADVASIAWDIKNQQTSAATTARPFWLEQGDLDGTELADVLQTGTVTQQSLTALATEELQAWSDGALARRRLALLRGRISCPGFGQVKLLDGLELAGIGKHFNGITLVTGIRHQIDRNGWRTDLQFGLAAEWFAEQPDIIAPPAAGLLPGVSGLQIGVVADFEDDPDQELRVKLTVPGFGDADNTVWARLAAPVAGNGRGFYFRPEPGDEVIVGFFNDDPRQAVILGALYSSKNAPPADLGPPNAENKLKAIVTRTGTTIQFTDDEQSSLLIQTPNQNKIQLDDQAKSITLADQHGNTITLDQNGIVIKSDGDVTIEASRNVTLKGEKVEAK